MRSRVCLKGGGIGLMYSELAAFQECSAMRSTKRPFLPSGQRL